MATRVSNVRSSRRSDRGFDVCEVVFSIAEARRALPYAARLLDDALRTYLRVQEARQALLDALRICEHDELIRQRDFAIDRLNEIIDECNAVGLAYIHIPTGRAAFRSEVAQRPVTLLWRVGQPIRGAWRELDQTDASRSPAPDAASAIGASTELKPEPAPARSTASAA